VSNRIGFIGIRLPQIETAWGRWYFRLALAMASQGIKALNRGMDQNWTATYGPPRHIWLHN